MNKTHLVHFQRLHLSNNNKRIILMNLLNPITMINLEIIFNVYHIHVHESHDMSVSKIK